MIQRIGVKLVQWIIVNYVPIILYFVNNAQLLLPRHFWLWIKPNVLPTPLKIKEMSHKTTSQNNVFLYVIVTFLIAFNAILMATIFNAKNVNF